MVDALTLENKRQNRPARQARRPFVVNDSPTPGAASAASGEGVPADIAIARVVAAVAVVIARAAVIDRAFIVVDRAAAVIGRSVIGVGIAARGDRKAGADGGKSREPRFLRL